MSDRFVTHDTMVLERTYPVSPSRVFAAWADQAAKQVWFTGSEPDEFTPSTYELDFRVGGREFTRGGPPSGDVFTYEARYEDIVDDERIVYSYYMLRGDVRISVSVACVEFTPDGDGTRLVLTEHGVYLDGEDKPEFRAEGIGQQLDTLNLVVALMSDRTRWVALYVLCSGMLMIVLDVTIVNVALPSIQDDLGFGPSGLAWVINAYLITFGGLLLLAGRLGDLFGRRRVFLCGLVVFTAASALCGLARSPWQLVVARFVQGAGGALTSAVILGMIVTMFPEPRERARAIGAYAFVASAGGAVGLLAGGVLTQWVSWHWIFFVNLPVGITVAILARRLLPADEVATARSSTDVLGAVLITAAVMLGVYTIVVPAAQQGWVDSTTATCACGAVLLLAAFVVRESTATQPLMPLRILRSRNITAANLMQIVGAGGMYGSFFLGALYLQHVLHYDPLEIGLAFLPVSVLMGGLSVRYSERLVSRYGLRQVMIPGLVLITAGLALFAHAPSEGTYLADVLPVMLLLGVGAGLAFPPMMTLAMSDTDGTDAGLASGLINTTGQVGGAIGLAVLATAATGRTGALLAGGASSTVALTGGYQLALWIAAAMMASAIVVALVLVRDRSAARELALTA